MNQVIGLYNYWIVIFLMMTGFYIVIARTNLIQKVIGLNIFQISVFLLYITMGKVTGGTAPILLGHTEHAVVEHAVVEDHESAIPVDAVAESGGSQTHDEPADHDPDEHDPDTHEPEQHAATDHHNDHGSASGHSDEHVYTHPLPSVLMLTAIVVGVATTALALALIIRIGEAYGTIEEDEILEQDRAAS